MASKMLSGSVKWFNSKHKYGFITVLSEGEFKNIDLFVHQSNIITKEPCYRFLVAGENVKFELKSTNDEKHPNQAVNITGINDISLKCEIPRQPRQYNDTRTNDNRTNDNRTTNTVREFTPRNNVVINRSENGGNGTYRGRGRGNGTYRGRGNGTYRGRGNYNGTTNSSTISTTSTTSNTTSTAE